MDKKIYKVILADGTVIDNLTLNGNNFISKEPIDSVVFTANCSPVVINDGSIDEVHEHMELVQIMENGNEFWFVLRDITEKELEQAQIKSDIEYIAMMCDVDL